MRELTSKIFLIIAIIVLGILVRFFKLADFPVQLNHDEVTQLYDAISIAQTGKDIYGNFLPFIFPSIGDFKPPFYTYITSLLYLIFGGGDVTIRLASSIFGVLIIPAVYIFTSRLLKNSIIALSAAFLTSIAPFEIFFSRKSFENGAGIFFILLGFTSLLSAMQNKASAKSLYLSAIFFGVTMYTYFSHIITLPLLLIAFTLIYKEFFLVNLKKTLLPLSFFVIFLLPLIILIITNPNTRFRSQTVFVTQDVNLGRNIDYSKTDNQILDFFTKNKAIVDFSFNKYLDQFSVTYLFSNGLDFTNQGSLGVGPLLFIQLPFLVLGIIYLVTLKGFNREKKFVLVWTILGMIPSGLTFESHSPHRSVMVFTMFNIISGAGLYSFCKSLRNLQGNYQILKKLIPAGIVIAFGINLLYFFHMYFVNFPYEKSQYIQYPFKQIAQYVWSQYDNFDVIIFDPKFGDVSPMIGVGAHYYLAYYGNYPPAKFQKEYRLGNKPRETIFDKFSIREVYWPEDRSLKNALIIVSPWTVPLNDIEDKSKIVKTFYFYNNKKAFYAIKL